MTVSTDGIICLGVDIGDELPFECDDEDFERWWRNHKGYQNPFELFDETGNWIEPRASDAKIEEYFAVRREWEKKNPIPFEMVNVCSNECPEWIIAVPGSVMRAHRGCPVKIPSKLQFDDQKVLKRYMDFLKSHDITEEPSWYFASYWG